MDASPELLSFWLETNMETSIGEWDTHPGAGASVEIAFDKTKQYRLKSKRIGQFLLVENTNKGQIK